ncbi:WbqC family protein [Paraglaciecola chathamensis]|uniref:WbqC family protein n=1 Tax=Paraglaciecola chathamensis TaxID=368405 RepID=UPI00270DD489|nr:WbqC family protein [Paraglaciecola chathamensis]MDO6838188.1 WbqC family protein [Paraglaciecola chathamensis]
MQPYFLPYLGYWQMMHAADKFVLYDDVNFIKKGWVNRNRILVNGAAHYVGIPIRNMSQNTKIYELDISETESWRRKNLKTIEMSYKKAPFFSITYALCEDIFLYPKNNLSEFINHSIVCIQQHLGIRTELVPSKGMYNNIHLTGKDRIIDICHQESISNYINAPGGRALYDVVDFKDKGVNLKFVESQLPVYNQGKNEFHQGLSILDVLMFNRLKKVQEFLGMYELLDH